jgi:hypothetical protein
MPFDHDLTSEKGISAYLTSIDIEHSDVKLLTGGTANFVYRVTLSSGKTTVYKHAAPYLHSNTSFSFDPARMDYEAHVLKIIPSLVQAQAPLSIVHAASVGHYDSGNKVLCMEDGGKRHLKDAYTDPSIDISRVGTELGSWLAAVHTSTTRVSLSLTPDNNNLEVNNATGVSVYRYAYANLATALEEYCDTKSEIQSQSHAINSQDISLAQEINDDYGSRLAYENECICHGDFWPGNVLVRSKSEAPSSDIQSTTAAGSDLKLTVVDWEMTRRGTSATDVAQFCAEAFLLDRFRGGRGLLRGFLNAYLTARFKHGRECFDREWVRRMAIHWGVHVAFWPTRVEWADREGTQKLVAIGVDVLRTATEGRWKELFSVYPLKEVEDWIKEIVCEGDSTELDRAPNS